MEKYKAIETLYHGYRFRSRLEARWAVFFDTLGIEYEYEPEGFVLPSGKNYLPDFKLHGFAGRGPNLNSYQYHNGDDILWCEVKGINSEEELYDEKREDYYKVEEFANFKKLEELWKIERKGGDVDSEEYIKAWNLINQIIVLPNIPEESRDWLFYAVTRFEFVDGDDWPCIISKPNLSNKEFVLLGQKATGDPGLIKKEYEYTDNALKKARYTRFEFSEKDLQPLENEVEMLRKRKELLEEKERLTRELNGK